LSQIVISLDYFAQLVLRAAVPAVAIRVVAFHQFLEARLDLGLGGPVLEIELVQAFALGAPQGPGPLVALILRRRFGAIQPKGVIRLKAVSEAIAPLLRLRRSIAGPGIHPHEPGGAVADRVVLLVLSNVFVRHAGEVVVGLVILADVLEAETVVLALLAAALRRRVKPRLRAALPFASWAGIAHEPGRVWLDAEAVEEFRVEFHQHQLWVVTVTRASFAPSVSNREPIVVGTRVERRLSNKVCQVALPEAC